MALNQGLPVSTLIAVSVSLAVTAAQGLNFNSLLIVGDSNVINTKQRIREYSGLTGVANDFGNTAPEYLGAKDYFDQAPQPSMVYVGRWAKTATAGLLLGGILLASQQALANFTGIVNGGFHISVDGGASTNVTGINLTGAVNLNGVAALIQAALQALGGSFAGVTCTWNSIYSQFQIVSGTTGAASQVSFTTAPVAGTDLGPLILTNAATASYSLPGIAAESALTAVTILDQLTTQWYGLTFATLNLNTDVADSDYLSIAAYIEADSNPHLFGLTSSETAALSSSDNTSIGYQLHNLSYNRTGFQWSSMDPYAICSLLGVLLTVNFLGTNTTLTVAWKQEPGIGPELLTEAQAVALNTNNWNYYASINNGTSIIFNGTVASGHYWDEIIGCDWLANYIQTNVFNVLYTTGTKIPQTDAGMNTIAGAIETSCAQGVTNGLLAPGVWNSAGFGQLLTGGYLGNGYYVYTPPISSQTQSSRSARVSVPFQVAAKLAGAVQSADVAIVVNQ